MFRTAAASLLLFGSVPSAWACSCWCDFGKPVSEILDSVTPAVVLPEAQVATEREHHTATRYRVLDAFGAELPGTVVAETHEEPTMCGWSPEIGKPVLVGFEAVADKLETSMCGQCLPPLNAVTAFHETGVDIYIRSKRECSTQEGEADSSLPGCGHVGRYGMSEAEWSKWQARVGTAASESP